MNEKQEFSELDKSDAALIIREDGSYELIVPEDDDALTLHVMNVIMKMLKNEELLEYVLRWEKEGEFNFSDAEEVWH